MQNDWKVLTLLIGANDLCGSCELSNPASEPDIYESGVMAVLEEVRASDKGEVRGVRRRDEELDLMFIFLISSFCFLVFLSSFFLLLSSFFLF